MSTNRTFVIVLFGIILVMRSTSLIDGQTIEEKLDGKSTLNLGTLKAQSPWNSNLMGRLSKVYLLIKAACFVKKENNIFNIKKI